MGINAFLNWFHSHGHTPLSPTAGPVSTPAASIPVPNDHPYVNGMKDPVAGGFVMLQEAERVRSQALASRNPKLVAWAASLPYRYAIQAAQTQPELAMSPDDVFSNEENCQYAKMFLQGALIGVSWCPQAFIATHPLAGEHKLYDQGPALSGYASFDPTITPDKLAALFDASLLHASS